MIFRGEARGIGTKRRIHKIQLTPQHHAIREAEICLRATRRQLAGIPVVIPDMLLGAGSRSCGPPPSDDPRSYRL